MDPKTENAYIAGLRSAHTTKERILNRVVALRAWIDHILLTILLTHNQKGVKNARKKAGHCKMPAMREGLQSSNRCVGKKPMHYLRVSRRHLGVFAAQGLVSRIIKLTHSR